MRGCTAAPWLVVPSPTDGEMSAVQGAYLVADKLPIEDARLIAAAPDLVDALQTLVGQRDGYFHTAAAWDAARAAIARALGTTNEGEKA